MRQRTPVLFAAILASSRSGRGGQLEPYRITMWQGEVDIYVAKVELISVTASDIGRYRAECVLLPGCFVEGSSLHDVLSRIENEIKEYVEQSRAIGWSLPDEVDAYLARPRSNTCGGI